MKQIVDKLNKIAKKIDESVEIPQTDLIIDSLDAITKAYGGTPNDSNLIVDKLEDIYNNIGPAVSGNIEITENGENINVAQYATATVNVSGGLPTLKAHIINKTRDEIYSEDTVINVKGEYSVDSLFITEAIEDIEIFYASSPMGHLVALGDLKTTSAQQVVSPAFTDLVNCQIAPDNVTLIITDPSESSSATITLTASVR